MADDTPAVDGGAPSIADSLQGALASVVGRSRIVITPYPFGVAANDFLRIKSANWAPGVVLEIHGRLAIPGKDAIPFRFVHTPNTDRTVKTQDYQLGEGIVTNLNVFATAGAAVIGQTFVVAQLCREQGANSFSMGTLLAGTVTQNQPIGWPGSPIVNSLEALPVLRTITGTKPAAGAEIAEAVPTNARWDLLSVLLQFQASGAGGTRFPDLRVRSGGVTVAQYLSNVGVGAGGLSVLQFAPNLPNVVYAGFGFATAACGARVILRAGDSFVTDTPGKDVADQYETPWYQVLEYLDVP